MTINTPKRKTPDVPILPMVDLLSILLVFFIVTSQFKKEDATQEAEQAQAQSENQSAQPQIGIQINLPTSKKVPATQLKESYPILAVKSLESMELDGVPVESMDELILVLQSYKSQNIDQKLQLIADQGLEIQSLIAIWDALTEAGYAIQDTPFRVSAPKTDE